MDITHNLRINASAETVYNAVATSQGIKGWWCINSAVSEEEGGQSLLKFNKQGMIVDMGFRTETLEPNQKVIWQCVAMLNPAWIGTKIVTEITPDGSGCQVRFAHTDFDEKWTGQEPFEQTRGTWGHFVASLVSYCESGNGQPW